MGRLAWVFSGGGAKGAFGAGVLQRILERYPRLDWQIVTGTSTGSLIAPFAALAANDRSQIDALVRLYSGVRKKSVFQSNLRGFKVIKALFDLPEGLVNLKPLGKLLETELGGLIAALADGAVDLVVPAVNLQEASLMLCTQSRNQQRIHDWFQHNEIPGFRTPLEFWPFAELLNAMQASSAVPLGTQPIWRGNAQYVDGGVFDKAPLREALALGADAAIVVLMSPPPTPKVERFKNLIDVGLRAVDLLQDELLRGDLANQRLAGILHKQGVTVAELDRGRVAPEVCTYLNAASNSQTGSDGKAATGADLMRTVLVEPAFSVGSGNDFDSKVLPGWPESGSLNSDRDRRGDIAIMAARIAYGRRRVDQLLDAPDSELKALLDAQ
ncbi:MAG: patatin-like phospholipase family protein [Lysobacterales bacterium]